MTSVDTELLVGQPSLLTHTSCECQDRWIRKDIAYVISKQCCTLPPEHVHELVHAIFQQLLFWLQFD